MSVEVASGHRAIHEHADAAPDTVHLLTEDPEVRRRVENWLDGHYPVRAHARDPAAVLERTVPPDVVVIDCTDGVHTHPVTQLRDGGHEGAVVVLVDAEPPSEAQQMRDTEWLVGPTSEEELAHAVRRLFRRRRFRELLARDFETTRTLAELEVGHGADLHGLEVRTLLERKVRVRGALREVQARLGVADYAAILREGVAEPAASIDGGRPNTS